MRRHPGGRELAVFTVGYLTYFGVRAVTEGRVDRALANAASLVHLERVLGIAWEGAVQSTVAGSRFLEDLANAIYIYGHWPVLILAGVLLYRYRREHYYTLRNVCLLTGLLGLFVFALFPVAPPRLTDLPLVDTVTKGASGYRQILPAALVNQYAAMPSFHAGWNLAVGIVVFRATHHWALRLFAVLMPAAMMFAVVATANHFVIDVIVGVTLVLVALAVQRVSVVPRRLHVGIPGGIGRSYTAPSLHGHDRHRAPAGG
ncbi:MAG TPA: phosphatase PAP2 family protein [Solirubrobacter sp.]